MFVAFPWGTILAFPWGTILTDLLSTVLDRVCIPLQHNPNHFGYNCGTEWKLGSDLHEKMSFLIPVDCRKSRSRGAFTSNLFNEDLHPFVT